MELALPEMSYQDMLDAQRDLFKNQIEKLQQVVATQCKLTGVNPLSQEMVIIILIQFRFMRFDFNPVILNLVFNFDAGCGSVIH